MLSGNSYNTFPTLYDLLYQRYLASVPDFVSLIARHTPAKGAILDLAAGTGEVSIPLLHRGFAVTSLDRSKGMLNVLQAKAKKEKIKNARVKICDMQRITYRKQFDAVCIRQAVNYFIGAKALTKGLLRVRAALKPGGALIFNAPNYHDEKAYPPVANIYDRGTRHAFVLETNMLSGRLLKHVQYSLVWEDGKKPEYVTDENSFYMFTKKEFNRALRHAGFFRILFSGSGKTLYCVANI
ncbi:MAG: hypothetical protein A3I44_01880 [Candidatus Sungbacteria bacterium RIFCSPLOWO2_02_FULL_51_17]|nr:MAG: hypothetical protein A2676_04015 [Candidatus Sungbacteria bacterium RIFCSPHIGHO2_01_FULL_51_22]OHA05805.1 MAG: hypothetical protein A3B29_03240 [Candidatus Sungbacteria bacterium RIFCSPLOWO2_01_FULL_51_34]OHA11412.1 MAG: hypothetical protein A3I44_01880 [Candidatus Sungbacteria bacterium RIFCSPLOWO2_02_FULL_51_17]